MPRPESIALIDAYWRRRSACTDDELTASSTVIRSFPADPKHRFNVIAAHRLGGGCVINVHDHLLAEIEHLRGVPARRSFDQDTLESGYRSRRMSSQSLPTRRTRTRRICAPGKSRSRCGHCPTTIRPSPGCGPR